MGAREEADVSARALVLLVTSDGADAFSSMYWVYISRLFIVSIA